MAVITGNRKGAKARRTDPATSHAAAASINPKKLRQSQQAILKVMGRFRNGATDQDIARYYGFSGWAETLPQSPSGLRTRRAELVDLGLVVDSGERKRLPSGRKAIVWAKAKNGAK
ncbi:hypothetical protein SEQ_HALENA_58 [Mycobacterium phage Halena]|uniref:Helix-turn-helix DNA binding domain protein n=5 Tax=Bronvirus TaxID=1623278 RepID=E0YPJ2_9CAUD|nr:hypothetical protein LEBRON_59 [Mycobacterium phage LeBron]YP_010105459.1 LamD-like [Mycobacterium phage DirkDirk]AEK07594.1 hypothetical protein UPIE_60 [Mycobacterium phage UPIE]ASR86043.1 hypothetical protein SEA_APPLETREE2_60 [Mycobacterium phage Appletree2]AYD82239.1 hypothetical protein SEA_WAMBURGRXPRESS_60 [Mycobacterium phage Wamburgrxpress]QBP29842.1 hypothetical protein SEQ_HALENA_58 [Mycobacterium phage Halena]ADL71023.1 hypothetical protein LEBRON_59 [Mycobacterium phage LeBro